MTLTTSSAASKNTDALLLKLEPLIDKEKLGPPATVFTGNIDAIVVAAAITSSAAEFDFLPSAFRTTTERVPIVVMKDGGTVALSADELITVVLTGTSSISTCGPVSKSKPDTNNGNAPPPTVTSLGKIDKIVGGGGTIVRTAVFDRFPPSFRT